MNRLGIKQVLENWYVFVASQNIFVMEYIISIEQAIKHLVQVSQIDDTDLLIIDRYSRGYSLSEISQTLGISRQAVSKRFDRVTDLMLLELGDG